MGMAGTATPSPAHLSHRNRKAAKATIAAVSPFRQPESVPSACPVGWREARRPLDKLPGAYPCAMDKKEIESSKLTANFLLWIGAFMILLFVLLAHFIWKVF